jgi:holo-[acyl-carrier protein] synthase
VPLPTDIAAELERLSAELLDPEEHSDDVRVGTDLVEIARVESLIKRWGSRFTEKWFSDGEIAYCEAKHLPAHHYAGRLAAKEAVYKALRPDRDAPFSWRMIEITRERGTAPEVHLSGALREQFPDARVDVSISHTHEYAIAVAVVR